MTAILLIEGDRDIREAIAEVLENEGYDVLGEASIARGLPRLQTRPVDLVLCDCGQQQAFEDHTSVELMNHVGGAHPTPVGLIATWPIDERILDRTGAAFSLRKPFTMELLLATLAGVLTPVTPREAQPESDIIHRYFEALANRDWAGLGRLCAEDVVYHLPARNEFGQTVHGREAFVAFSRSVFEKFREARFDDVQVYRLPTSWTARYSGSWATHDGSRHTLPGGVVFRLRDGEIASIGVRLNAEQLASLE